MTGPIFLDIFVDHDTLFSVIMLLVSKRGLRTSFGVSNNDTIYSYTELKKGWGSGVLAIFTYM